MERHKEKWPLLDHVPCVMWSTDTALRFTSWAGGALKSLTVDLTKLAGRSVREFFREPDHVGLRAHLGALEGRTERYHLHVASRDFEARVEPLRAEDGSISGVLGVAVDVTERVAAERQQREQALFLANVRDAVIVTDQQGIVTYWNDGATKIFGWSADEMIGRPYVDRFPPEVRPRMAKAVQAHVAGLDWSGEVEDWRKDGSRVWIEAEVRALRDESGQRKGVIGIAHDIEARRVADAAARRSRELLEAVIEGTTDAVFVKDRDGRYLLVNGATARYVGRPASEIIGCTDADLFDAASVAIIAERDRAVIEQGVVETAEEHLNADGQRRVFLATKGPYRDGDGKVVGLIGVSRDISDRKVAEEALRAAEERYHQAQKMESFGRLAGGVAHDFNNLLTVVNGCGEELLPLVADRPAAHALVEDVLGAGRRAAALTKQLLAFSRKQIFAPSVLDLNELLHSLGNMLARLLGEDVVLTLDLAPSLPRVFADRGQIEQVFMNLAVNARDAMPTGGRLTIRSALTSAIHPRPAEMPKEEQVCVVVEDSGIGMDGATMSRIFEPFFTTKPSGHGTGLGLATAYGIVHQSGGQIFVESEPGRGAKFFVVLPITNVIERAVDKTRPRVSAAPGGPTILLVEDEPEVRKIAARILASAGYAVLQAGNGRDALDVVRAHVGALPLVVTDVVMPVMSGTALAQELAALRPATRVLFMSGFTGDAVAAHGLPGDARNFLQKPFTRELLLAKVREVLA